MEKYSPVTHKWESVHACKHKQMEADGIEKNEGPCIPVVITQLDWPAVHSWEDTKLLLHS